ncbi:myristylated tegument protein CIRC [Spheniscid alphaherpesvirus 1]|uniref:Myristylated tegument protein CIRC n=1 Tax=Spheniscid alphaherpesvirus 1 TaxID=2560777 RepID=A0A1R3T3I2_9ALPH|nr:myristylated tegument protein CIRC [Spheniscid alphaherpesvirus 1]
MGSILSRERYTGWDEVKSMVRILKGRSVDLPGGGSLWISPEAGKLFKEVNANMKFVGRATLPDCSREFTLFIDNSGIVYGLEKETGLHRLSKSLREFIGRVGLSRRDMIMISFHRSESFTDVSTSFSRGHANRSSLIDTDFTGHTLPVRQDDSYNIHRNGQVVSSCLKSSRDKHLCISAARPPYTEPPKRKRVTFADMYNTVERKPYIDPRMLRYETADREASRSKEIVNVEHENNCCGDNEEIKPVMF